MSQGQLFLISAPSGAGKTSLVDAALKEDPALVVSVSHTTRERRDKEQNGVNYHFVSRAEFAQMVENDRFLEHAKVFGNQYGTSREQVRQLRARGRDVILEIDWQGADQVRRLIPEAVSIFILPPDEKTLEERLMTRGQDSAETIETRLAEARLDISQAPRYNFIVVNEHFETALQELLTIIRASRLTAGAQTANNPLVSGLLQH